MHVDRESQQKKSLIYHDSHRNIDFKHHNDTIPLLVVMQSEYIILYYLF